MSWHERGGRRGISRGAVQRLGLAALPALLLGGCLQPLYSSVGDSQPLAEELKTVQVVPISGRLGHYLGNELIFALNGTGSHVPARYRLVVTTNEGVSTPLVDTVTGLVTSATVATTANYVLTDMDTAREITHGKVYVTASYDRTSERFSDMRAARDAEQRDARTLADQIRTQVAAALSTRT